jgi:predicted TIM-barrel fold metal-dependent hydrolase
VASAHRPSIVDAHQHFWDPGVHYYPWLNDEPPIPFRYGDYRAIRRRYLPPDYLADAAGWLVEKTVYVETEWNPADPVGEMRYVEALRREHGLPTVAVAQAWLHHENSFEILERQAAFPFVRSIRHKPPPGAMADAKWRSGFSALARNRLRFDLQAPWSQLGDAARLAADFPDTQIILNHTGLPAERSAQGIAGWKRAMTGFAACPNTALKISGLGQAGLPWTVAANRPVVLAAIEIFGAGRCMFASNFPVDSLCGSFSAIYDGFAAITRDFSEQEKRALFHDNAIQVYGMNEAMNA